MNTVCLSVCLSADRPDIVLFESETGVSIKLDISLAHPWSKDNLNKAACEEGYAAKKREEKKCDKYNNERLPGGTNPTFTPLVLDHFGHWGSTTESFLSELAKKSRDLEGNKLCRVQDTRRSFSL